VDRGHRSVDGVEVGGSSGTRVDPANGGSVLWQHLFRLFGHREVYIAALASLDIVSGIFPVLAANPFGYRRSFTIAVYGGVSARRCLAPLHFAIYAPTDGSPHST
jgi:hypothetical protein